MDAEGLGFLSSLNRGEFGNMGSGSVFRFGRTLGLGFGFSGDCEWGHKEGTYLCSCLLTVRIKVLITLLTESQDSPGM